MKKVVLTLVLILLPAAILLSQANQSGDVTPTQEPEVAEKANTRATDWDQIIFVTAFLAGMFVLFPIVLYTNMKEGITPRSDLENGDIKLIEGLTEEERNQRAEAILRRMESQLSEVEDEDGNTLLTIKNGRQAKYVKRAIDYINKRLDPTDEDLRKDISEFTSFYETRAKRVFVGSKFILGAGIGVGIFMIYTGGGGIETYHIFHFTGVLFYFLASRAPMYIVEKRMELFGGSVFGGMLTGLFVGDGTKYYTKSSGSGWQRDWETEGMMSIIKLFLMIVVALFVGVFITVIAVANVFMNYTTSFLVPFASLDKWFTSKVEPELAV